MEMTFGFEAEALVAITDLRLRLRDKGHPLGWSKYLKIRKDFSQGGSRGWMTELQLGPIGGLEAAKKELLTLLDGLRVMGAKLSLRCGLHIHVGTVPPEVDWIAGIVATELYWLPVQDRYFELAYGERWFADRHCWARMGFIAPWREDQMESAAKARSPQDIRHHAFNAAGAIEKHRTIEYRLWPMTFDDGKALEFLQASAEHASSIDWKHVISHPKYQRYKQIAVEMEIERERRAQEIHQFFLDYLRAQREEEERKKQDKAKGEKNVDA